MSAQSDVQEEPTAQPSPTATSVSSAQEDAAADFRDRWIRAEAEIANIRAIAAREVADVRLYAVQKFAKDVVEGVENLRRGLESLPPIGPEDPIALTTIRDGFAGVERAFLTLLQRNNILREEALGLPFDPNRHQSMGDRETQSARAGTVVAAMSGTWTLNGRLLRPAMVIVAKTPTVVAVSDARTGSR